MSLIALSTHLMLSLQLKIGQRMRETTVSMVHKANILSEIASRKSRIKVFFARSGRTFAPSNSQRPGGVETSEILLLESMPKCEEWQEYLKWLERLEFAFFHCFVEFISRWLLIVVEREWSDGSATGASLGEGTSWSFWSSLDTNVPTAVELDIGLDLKSRVAGVNAHKRISGRLSGLLERVCSESIRRQICELLWWREICSCWNLFIIPWWFKHDEFRSIFDEI